MSMDRMQGDVLANQATMAETREMPRNDPPFPPEQCRGETCRFVDGYDSGTLDPVGPRCGRTVTQVIYWIGRRYSPCCEQHGIQALDIDAIPLVLCIHPIEALS